MKLRHRSKSKKRKCWKEELKYPKSASKEEQEKK